MKMLNVVRGSAAKMAVLAGGALALVAGNAMAQTDSYSAITTAVDWSTVSTDIITIFGLGAAVIVAFVGGKFLLRAIRGA